MRSSYSPRELLRPLGYGPSDWSILKYLQLQGFAPKESSRDFTFRPMGYSSLQVACWEFWSQIGHMEKLIHWAISL